MSDVEFEYSEEEIDNSSDSQSDADDAPSTELKLDNIEDENIFRKNYDTLKKNNISSIYLNKYEITKILSKRCEQLENGSSPLISNPEIYNNVYDIAFQELKQKPCKIPFILKRYINNKYEYWKLNDLHF